MTKPKKARELSISNKGGLTVVASVVVNGIRITSGLHDNETVLAREVLPTDVTLPRAVVEQVLDQMNYMHPGTEITRALESALKSHSQEGQG